MDHQPSQNTVSYCGIPKEVGWGVVHFCHHLGPYFKLGQKTRTTVDRRARRESLQGLGAFVESVCNLLLAVQLASYFIILFFERVVYPTDVLHSWHHLERLER